MADTDSESGHRTRWVSPVCSEPQTVETSAGPLALYQLSWGDLWKGTAAALIAHGLAKLEQFPGQPGNRKSACRYPIRGEPGGELAILKTSPRRFEVHVGFGEERLALCREQQRASVALHEAERSLQCMPQSAKQFREMALMMTAHSRDQRKVIDGIGCGYRFSNETWLEYEEAIDEAHHALLAGTVVFDKAVRERYISKYRHGAAAADPAFQRFREQVTTLASQVGADDSEAAPGGSEAG